MFSGIFWCPRYTLGAVLYENITDGPIGAPQEGVEEKVIKVSLLIHPVHHQELGKLRAVQSNFDSLHPDFFCNT